MYVVASKIGNLPIISLQTGEVVALIRQPIIDIANLQIVALHCNGTRGKQPLILLARDIRQLAPDCAIVDNENELTEPSDIVRLQGLIHANYTPLGNKVVTESGRKIGTVEDYAVNLETNRLQKLYVRQSLISSWLGESLMIDRSQIVDVTPKRFTVRDTTVKAPLLHPQHAPGGQP